MSTDLTAFLHIPNIVNYPKIIFDIKEPSNDELHGAFNSFPT